MSGKVPNRRALLEKKVRALTLWSVGKPFKDRKQVSSSKSSSVKGSLASKNDLS